MKSQSPSLVAQGPTRLRDRRERVVCSTLLALLLLTAQSALAAETPRGEAQPVPAKGPLVSELRENLDPDRPGHETVIRKYEDAQGNQVREFMTHGAIYQLQVIPVNGAPYYLIDTDGDGLFESRSNGYELQIAIPHWVLFRY
ncbi:MAG: DUF2782 domain-containing protein [Magnetococcales bacterium]|nr:DUF2782 domain-containing protein [Magnetococcales bacterium]